MNDDELLPIGHFARLSGLTIHALRHYDDVGLLAPAVVDPRSGYHRYRREQIATAKLISSLRWIDLPIGDIRQILNGSDPSEVLVRHRRTLERQHDHLLAQLGDVNAFLEKGLPMPQPPSGVRPVQIKLAVTDEAATVEFYTKAFGLAYQVTRRTDDEDFSSFMFGEYGQDSFFLLHLLNDPQDYDRPGATTFGLLVPDLDETHRRAIEAGGTEVVPPMSPQGMPRCSAVRDPSGNWVWLYQG